MIENSLLEKMSSSSNQVGEEAASSEDHSPAPISSKRCDDNNFKGLVVVYKECLKNHAATLGGNATDGCGEFMPSTSQDNLRCCACGCHRNFHHKEVYVGGLELGYSYLPIYPYWITSSATIHDQQVDVQCDNQRKELIRARLTGPQDLTSPSPGPINTYPKMEVEKSKKRCRTKFTEEQKVKMVKFANKVGWKIQKLDAELVQQFCQEVGIIRRVLKVWMHNNKHLYLKKNIHDPSDKS